MKLEDFIKSVHEHPTLRCEGLSIADRPEEDFIAVRDSAGMRFEVLVTTVGEQTWPVLESILTGRRRAIIMDHVSRIVGYYSKVRNWNKSKLGELRDRQAGDYGLESIEAEVAERPIPISEKQTKLEEPRLVGTEDSRQAVSAAG